MVFLLSVSRVDVDVVYENGVGDCGDDEGSDEEESCCRFLLFSFYMISSQFLFCK